MGWIVSIYKVIKLLAGVRKSMQQQRQLALDLELEPMDRLVQRSLELLNRPAGSWRLAARPPRSEAYRWARELSLPTAVRDFYVECDGFKLEQGEFPHPVLPLAELRLGSHCLPTPSARVQHYWAENGNEHEQAGMLGVLPADSLRALLTDAWVCSLPVSKLDDMMPLCPMGDGQLALLVLVGVSPELPRGSVLEVEGGSATVYRSFRAWLANQASLYGNELFQQASPDRADDSSPGPSQAPSPPSRKA